jgi:peptidoglycan/LPS O-acetylase OafA/YrhL
MRCRRVESAAGITVTSLVIVIGAAAGFTHTHHAAVRAGQAGWLAWADAIVIECLVVAAGFQLHRYRKARQSIRFPASVLVVAFVIQMGAQVSGAPRTFAGWLFAALPALACLVVLKLVFRSIEPVAESPASSSTVEASVVRDDRPAIGPAPERQPAVSSWPPRSSVSLTNPVEETAL